MLPWRQRWRRLILRWISGGSALPPKKISQNIADCRINANFGVKEVISQLNVVL
jgi:hypothetical protein